MCPIKDIAEETGDATVSGTDKSKHPVEVFLMATDGIAKHTFARFVLENLGTYGHTYRRYLDFDAIAKQARKAIRETFILVVI